MPEDHNDDADEPPSPQLVRAGRTNSSTVRRLRLGRASEVNLSSRMPSRTSGMDEHSSLLGNTDGTNGSYTSFTGSFSATPRARQSRRHSNPGSIRLPKNLSRSGSFSRRLVSSLTSSKSHHHDRGNLEDSSISFHPENRVWYDQVGSMTSLVENSG